MIANTQYNDLVGTAAADTADWLGGDSLKAVAKYFNLDENKFEIIGLSIYGTDTNHVSLVCVDRERSTDGNDFIVKMSIDSEKTEDIIKQLFKRLHIVLGDKHGRNLEKIEHNEEASFSEFHNETL